MPLVIFDGPEAAGKTTLIEALMKEWGPNSTLRSWGPRDSWLEYCQPLFDDLKATKQDPQCLVVWSRSWASRFVYNKLLSQGQSVPPSVTRELENIVVASGGLLYFVYASILELMSRRMARIEEGGHKPDHPISPEKELYAFQSYMRGRKWAAISGADDTDQEVRSIIYRLVQRNPECRMRTREERVLEAV